MTAPSSQFATGQVAVLTTPTQLSATPTNFTNGVKLTSLSGNSVSLFIGGSAVTITTGDELPAGSSVILGSVQDLSSVYAVSASSTTLTFLGLL
jgi:hypothetical protein